MKNLPEVLGMIAVVVVLCAHMKYLRKTAKRLANGPMAWREFFLADMDTPRLFRWAVGGLILIAGLAALVAAAAPWVQPRIHAMEHLEVALPVTAVFLAFGVAFTYLGVCSLRNQPFFRVRRTAA